MRQSLPGSQWSATVILLGINAAVFVVEALLSYYGGVEASRYLALSGRGLLRGWVWQLLTFQFLHAGPMHLLFNSLAIYVFGRAVEEHLGARAFLKLYFLSGVLGGLCQVLGGWVWPGHVGGGPVVGASAGAFGLVAAYAALFPERPLTMLFALFIPVTLRAKFLLFGGGALALFGLLVPTDHVAHAAHLGGMLTGLAYVVWIVQPASGLIAWRPGRAAAARRARPMIRLGAAPSEPTALPPLEFISREVDPILDKISAQGIQSLSERERRILEMARHKIRSS